VRSQANNLSGTISWENKTLTDYTNVPVTASDKRVQVASVGLAGSHQDVKTGRRATAFEITLASGKLNMDAASLTVDNASARSNGAYSRTSFSVNHQEKLTEVHTLMLMLSGQQSNKNLNSSEKFSLGGANGVRAYPQGEGIGDQGWLANIEARHNFAQGLQGVVFYDTGSVTINKNPFTVGAANSRNIGGAGFGVNASYLGINFKGFAAWRTSGGQATSVPASVNSTPQLWVQASKPF
jgi:hemolysin activation/secretion protein